MKEIKKNKINYTKRTTAITTKAAGAFLTFKYILIKSFTI